MFWCIMGAMNDSPQFVPGLVLAEGFFRDLVGPILESHFPDLQYSAALIGNGSEVLGFDTAMSMDHHWGPRVMLFLSPEDFISKRDNIRTTLSYELPSSYRGFSTNFSEPDPEDNGVQMMQPSLSGQINHRVEIYTIKGFTNSYLNINLNEELQFADWLTLPQQKLYSITAGKVFKDDLGLERLRALLSWYPYDVWLYLLASAWMRIGQEEHLMGRAGSVTDEIGSSIIASRLVREIMRLAFLMEKVYIPYAKWFGTAFSQLSCARQLTPYLKTTLHATSWQEREASLCPAYEILVSMHNSLAMTEPISTRVSQFWSRNFRVIGGERMAKTIIQQITDPKVIPLTQKSLIGNIDLISDNTDLLMDESFRLALKDLYI
jgi:hypothetical protein